MTILIRNNSLNVNKLNTFLLVIVIKSFLTLASVLEKKIIFKAIKILK